MTGRDEPAQHPSAHLLLHRGEVFGCQRSGGTLTGVDGDFRTRRSHSNTNTGTTLSLGNVTEGRGLRPARFRFRALQCRVQRLCRGSGYEEQGGYR